jgi:hypothetical protein
MMMASSFIPFLETVLRIRTGLKGTVNGKCETINNGVVA